MNSKKLIVGDLVGERIILRELEEGDLDSVHEYASDPEVTRFTHWGPNSLKATKNHMIEVLRYQREPDRMKYDLAIEHIGDGKLIGKCSLFIEDRDKALGSIGYVLNKDYWGKGYVTEAAKLILKFGFEKLNLKKIIGRCDIDNIASCRVLEKIGMKKEGVLPNFKKAKGKLRDYYWYSIPQKR